jgi:hypothetical protein
VPGGLSGTPSQRRKHDTIGEDRLLRLDPDETDCCLFKPFSAYARRVRKQLRPAGPDGPWVETQHFSPTTPGVGDYAAFGGSVAVNRNGPNLSSLTN